MKDNLKTFPQDGKWMSAYKWKVRIEKELRDMLKENGDAQIQRYTADMLLEEILGVRRRP